MPTRRFLRSLSACLGFFFFGDFVGTLAPAGRFLRPFFTNG
jgi:hypothetical protein